MREVGREWEKGDRSGSLGYVVRGKRVSMSLNRKCLIRKYSVDFLCYK